MTPDLSDHPTRIRLLAAGVVALGTLVLVSCAGAPSPPTSPTPSPTPTDELNVVFALDFDGSDPLSARPSGAFTVTQESFFGGTLTFVDSRSGDGKAIKFPAFSESAEEPGVGLVGKAAGNSLPNPGASSFSFGADVFFDEIGASSTLDNGDNVIQRGLASDPSQLKLQVDHGVPSCSVTGTEGRLMVKGEPLLETTWYSLACLLTADGLELRVTDLDEDETVEFSEPGSVGVVSFAADVPLAIGRKTGPGGVGIKKQPDQFNGTMDSVWIAIDEDQ